MFQNQVKNNISSTFSDLNDDGLWDEFEIDGLFQSELNKIYNSKDHESFDSKEREEEMNRMREHYMKEFDLDKDRIITLKEFLRETELNAKNHKNEEWKVLVANNLNSQN